MRRTIAALLLAAVAVPAGAQMRGHRGGEDTQATPTPQPPAGAERATVMVEPVGMLIATFDANGDGKVSRAELAAGVERSYRAIDTSGSGRLGYIEFADWAERWLGDRNALPSPFSVDSNADNVITLAELQATLDRDFTRLDADKDGSVTRAELLTIHDAPGMGAFGDRPGGGRGGRHGGRRGTSGG